MPKGQTAQSGIVLGSDPKMQWGRRQRRGQEWKEQVLRCACHFCCRRLVPPPVGWGQEGHDISPD